MKTNRRGIHILSQSIWQQPETKNRMNEIIWRSAKEEDLIFEKEPVENRVTAHPARVHADFTRMLAGMPLKFPETRDVLKEIQAQLNEIGFVPVKEDRHVCSEELGIVGHIDAGGLIEGDVPVIIEVKSVRFLPQVVRASEAAQLMLYALARNEAQAGSMLLLAVYVQPAPPYRVGIRAVIDFEALEPIVRQLAA